MEKIDKCIKFFNIALTDTLSREDFFRIDYTQERINVNYNDCTSLFDLISFFNKMYLLFKSEYDSLEKIDLGKEINVLNYTKINDELRVLELLVYKPNVINDNYTHLYLREINGVSMPYITNDLGSVHSDGYYKKSVKIPDRVVKSYLDLFDKFKLFLELCKHFKNNLVFNDDNILLHTRVVSKEANFLDEIETFKISLHSNDDGSHIDIAINMDDESSINLEESYINIGGEEIKPTKELCMSILKKVFIYNDYLDVNKKQNSNIEVKESKSL